MLTSSPRESGTLIGVIMRSNFHIGLYVSDTKALLAQTPPLRKFLDKPNKLRFDQNDIIDPFYPCFPPGSKP
jgi:hypothetical protein